MSEAGPILGIDLGTTNSLVAIAGYAAPGVPPTPEHLAPRVLVDDQGRALVPSVVRYGRAASAPVVGYPASEQRAAHVGSSVASVKRLMGRSADEVVRAGAPEGLHIVPGASGAARVRLHDGHVLTPEEVSSHILAHLKRQAEARLGVGVSRAVITVPAYFDDAQRQATREAGRLAGLEVVRIVNEPTAAALAYGLGAGGRGAGARERIVVVYDLGGGTFDVSVLRITPGGAGAGDDPDMPEAFQVLATAGDTRLGGDDIDAAVVDELVRGLGAAPESTGVRAPNDDTGGTPAPPVPVGLLSDVDREHLRAAAERAKVALSSAEATRVVLTLSSGTALDRTLTRTELEALAAPLIERTLDACRRALRDAKRAMGGAKIDAVVLVGGSTRMPLVRRRVADMFGMEPYTALDPDQVVALGAAVQGSILSGARRDAVLLDVIPLSLGIGTVGGAVAKLIMRNSPVPARASEMFSTSVDKQTGIELSVYQGEREMASDCRLLGHFKLSGLPPMPAGIPKVRVTFDVDASGVLHVSAVEERSGKRASLQVVPAHGLTQSEVDRLERDSFTHAREDMTRHRVVDLIANARLDLRWVQPRAEALADQLAPASRDRVAAAITKLTALLEQAEHDWKSVNPDALHAAKDELDRASMPVHEASILASLQQDAGSTNRPADRPAKG